MTSLIVSKYPHNARHFASHHLLLTMTTFTYHCFLGEKKVSLSIDAASEKSQVSTSVVYALNLPCVFDKFGLQNSSVVIKVPTVGGIYISQMNLPVSYGLPSNVLLGYDWIILCQPTFIDNHQFILGPTLTTIKALPTLHSWQPINSPFFCFQAPPLF